MISKTLLMKLQKNIIRASWILFLLSEMSEKIKPSRTPGASLKLSITFERDYHFKCLGTIWSQVCIN